MSKYNNFIISWHYVSCTGTHRLSYSVNKHHFKLLIQITRDRAFVYRLNGEHSKIPLDLFAESEPSNGYNEKYCCDFSSNCSEQVHWNRTHFHSDIAHFMAFDFSKMFGAQIKFIEQRRQHRAHIHFTVHKTRIPCEFFCLRMSSTQSHAHTHIRSQRSPEKLTIIFVVPCTHINP